MTQDFTCDITVADKTAREVFEAVCRVSEWWTGDLEGDSGHKNGVFTVHFGKTFVTMQLVEFEQDKRVVWLVTDGYLEWLQDKDEWNGTKIVFEVSPGKVHMTHEGLHPGVACFEDCRKGWTFYIGTSLFKLLTVGRGQPATSRPTVSSTSPN